jgi:putative ABC transport system permease protein
MVKAMKRLAARARALFRGAELDREFAQELEADLEMIVEEYVRRGLTPQQARRAARIRIGNPVSLMELHRDARRLPPLDSILQDLRFAFRLIAKDRWFSAAAIGAMAIGIGANAAGFSLVHSVFLKGLPFEDSDRLYVLTWQQARTGRRSNVSYAELQDWRARNQSFEHIAAVRYGTMNISDDRTLAEHTRGATVTVNVFDAIRQRPLFGRTFRADDERHGAESVVIIGESLWRSRFGGDDRVLGKTLRVDGRPRTIVGVMPDGMKFPDNTSLWIPLVPSELPSARDARILATFGRLKDGTDRRAAQADMNAIAQQLITEYPEATEGLVGIIRVETFTERSVGGAARPMFLTVMGAVVFVLLIACANVANLLLSRSVYRAREIALRTAIGASRGRIVRQLLTESLVLSVAAGAIGLILAIAGVRLFDATMPPIMPYWIAYTVDYVVFGYVAAICILTAVLFGLVPALHASSAAVNDPLKEGGRGIAGSRRAQWFSSTMVVAELALTIVLLAGAGLMIRSFLTLHAIDLGIDSDKLVTMRVQLPERKYRNQGDRRAFFDRLEPRLAAIAGVEAAALTNGVPPHDGGERFVEIDGPPPAPDTERVMVGTVTITPAFFEVVGVRLLRGRSFHAADGGRGSETAIINDRFAEQFYPGEDPIGRRLRFTQRNVKPGQSTDVWRTVVGISPSIRHGSAVDRYANAVVYLPYREEAPANVSVLLRSALPTTSVMDAVRREVHAVDRDQPVGAIQTAGQVVAETRWWYRVWGSVFGVIAAIALVLSSLGLYAVIAYAVTQRTQEIGVRMAIGAKPWQVCWLVVKRGLVQLAVGLPVGLAGAFALSRLIWRGGVGPITTSDPVTFTAITVFLVAVALTACWLPARRAARVDPVVALRAD